jgi:hypothetical protein
MMFWPLAADLPLTSPVLSRATAASQASALAWRLGWVLYLRRSSGECMQTSRNPDWVGRTRSGQCEPDLIGRACGRGSVVDAGACAGTRKVAGVATRSEAAHVARIEQPSCRRAKRPERPTSLTASTRPHRCRTATPAHGSARAVRRASWGSQYPATECNCCGESTRP